MPLNIIYEDQWLLGVIKPPGLISQSEGEDIVSQLPYEAHVINRLDRPVGGIVLLTKDREAAAKITEQLTSGKVEKYYYAIVEGQVTQGGELIDYLMTNKRLNTTKVVNKGNVGAKEARLTYEGLGKNDNLTLLKVRLYTGRHHQIRAQLAAHSMPIWGDTKYNPAFKHKRGVVPGLFACELLLRHPYTGEEIHLRAVPDYGVFKEFSEEYYV